SLRDPELVPAKRTLQTLLNGTGSGRFTVLLDPGRDTDMAPYQGIAPREGDTVAEVLEAYMRNSEQLDTRLWLAADGDTVAGMLLQRLPDAGGIRPTHGDTPNAPDSTPESRAESWNRVTQLASTLTQPELLQADIDTIIHRLFWQEPLLQLETRRVQWHCPCTRTRVGNMLRMLGRDEIESLLQEREHITVSCNFCGKPYEFDAVDCAALFVENLDDSGSRTLHYGTHSPQSTSRLGGGTLPLMRCHHPSLRFQPGQGAVEFLLAAVPVLLLGLGCIEAVHWHFARQAVSL